MNYPDNVKTIKEKIEFVKSAYGVDIPNLFDQLIIDIKTDLVNKIVKDVKFESESESITEGDTVYYNGWSDSARFIKTHSERYIEIP